MITDSQKNSSEEHSSESSMRGSGQEKAQNKKRKWARSSVGVLFALGVLFSGRKAAQLSAEPMGEKDCPPLNPNAHLNGAAETAEQTQTNHAGVQIPAAGLTWAQKGGTINDASCLNRTHVFGIVQITSEEELQDALQYAADHDLKVSMAGVRHSMGGQAFYQQALILDMTQFNKMSLDEENQILTVQSGATWHDIQSFLHPRFAVKAMQSTDIFTVGGSISVNAHGMDHQVGALGKTIRSMRIMLADGSVQTISPTENQELFNLVVGGYGLFGILLDVELEITENAIYESHRAIIDYRDFPSYFDEQIGPNTDIGLMYVHLSTAPQSFLEEAILYTYEAQDVENPEIPPLGEVSSTKLRRFVINLSKYGSIPMRMKWFAEKHIEPRMESCSVISRNQAMTDGEACLVSRNEPMHDSVKYLKNNLQKETDILHEYFIPRAHFVDYVDGMRDVLLANDANVLNASVRVVHPESNFLNYAPEEMFSLVLYINQPTTEEGDQKMRQVTSDLIDLTNHFDGTFFLPYQLHYTPEQLEASYPQIRDFFAAKADYDPNLRFTNTFYERFAPHFFDD